MQVAMSFATTQEALINYIHTCICIYIYIYIYTVYTYIYTYIHL